MSTQTAYPLSWPMSWPRTAAHLRKVAPFFSQQRRQLAYSTQTTVDRKRRSMESVISDLYRELRLINVQDYNVVISTNVELRQDGQPYSNRKMPEDPGAAVFFKLKGKPCVLACDKWNRVEDNLCAIAKHIEALRGQERWGVGSVEQAFAGYTALPPAGTTVGASWWTVLGCAHDAPFDAVKEAYRKAAREAHPDNPENVGGHDRMVAVNAAYDQARQAFGQ